MLGPGTPADEVRKLRPCLQWVKSRQAVRECGKSASPHLADECWAELQVCVGP
jgi:hypothetical protein